MGKVMKMGLSLKVEAWCCPSLVPSWSPRKCSFLQFDIYCRLGLRTQFLPWCLAWVVFNMLKQGIEINRMAFPNSLSCCYFLCKMHSSSFCESSNLILQAAKKCSTLMPPTNKSFLYSLLYIESIWAWVCVCAPVQEWLSWFSTCKLCLSAIIWPLSSAKSSDYRFQVEIKYH